MHFYITGDTHRSFDRIEDFCYEYETTTEDVMIILGDAGINYWLGYSRLECKKSDCKYGYYIYSVVHGNHEGASVGSLRQIMSCFHGTADLYTEKKCIPIYYLPKMEKSIILTGTRPWQLVGHIV